MSKRKPHSKRGFWSPLRGRWLSVDDPAHPPPEINLLPAFMIYGVGSVILGGMIGAIIATVRSFF